MCNQWLQDPDTSKHPFVELLPGAELPNMLLYKVEVVTSDIKVGNVCVGGRARAAAALCLHGLLSFRNSVLHVQYRVIRPYTCREAHEAAPQMH